MLELQHELELARDKEVTVHSQLSRAVMCAEKATVERDTFAKIVSSCVINTFLHMQHFLHNVYVYDCCFLKCL